MNIYRISDITIQPIDVIAKDRDQAANLFLFSLRSGLGNWPDVDFAVAEWTQKRIRKHDEIRRWADEGKSGTVWSVDDGQGWEHVSRDFDLF
ncbi:MAG: hypothetical protein ABJA20_12735 [Novosphingobium sp.]